MPARFLCHVTGIHLPWLLQFSLWWHSQAVGSLCFTQGIACLVSSLFISHLDFVFLELYTNLASGYFIGCFLSQSPSLFFVLILQLNFHCLCTTHHLWFVMHFLLQFLTYETDSLWFFATKTLHLLPNLS